MRYPEPKPEEWKPLDFDDRYSAGQAYQRFQWLAEWDPYVALFGSDTITRLSNIFFSRDCVGFDIINTRAPARILTAVDNALTDSPFGKLLTTEFRARIVALVQTAVLSGYDRSEL